jgi:hypothetical protein
MCTRADTTIGRMENMNTCDKDQEHATTNNDVESDNDDDDQYKCFVHGCIGQRCFNRFANRYPRLFASTFGIFVPLLGLVIISYLLGYWIAHLESPIERQQNDARISSHVMTQQKLDILSNLTSNTPKICFNLFLNNITARMLLSSSLLDILYDDSSSSSNSTTTNDDDDLFEALSRIKFRYESIEDDTLPDSYDNVATAAFNVLDLYTFLHTCGEKFRSYIYNNTDLTVLPGENNHRTQSLPDLSFSWNRCTPHVLQELWRQQYLESLHPYNQTQYYVTTWEKDAARLFDEYYNYYTNTRNVSIKIATALAQNQSTMEASGGTACVVNTSAGGVYCFPRSSPIAWLIPQLSLCRHFFIDLFHLTAWFWFTIMSTIGYVSIWKHFLHGCTTNSTLIERLLFYVQGNASIETLSGRTLVYTFGFLSILFFGGVSLGAGGITVAIFKDVCLRSNHAKILTTPWIATFIWGSLYYTWMCVIANVSTYKTTNFEP